MKNKRILIITTAILSLCLSLGVLAGCGESSAASADGKMRGAIAVFSREDSSGTRGAFTELFDVMLEGADGKKTDGVRGSANIINSTGSILTSVQGNKQAISYVSMGSLGGSVKALQIDGVDATAANILNGTYKIQRPFNIVYKEGSLSNLSQDFIDFILSDEGQYVLTDAGFVSGGGTGSYGGGGLNGTIKIDGSSSIAPTMQKLKEAYETLNPDVTIELQSTSSGVGISSAIEGTIDIGMASRTVKDEEVAQGLVPVAICIDGIAVIVHPENPTDSLSAEQVKEIFIEGGSITKWEDIS